MRAFWTTADLLRLGKSERQIRLALEEGRLEGVRRGLFAAPGTAAVLIRAARVGGVATATTAATAMGLWTPPDLPPGQPYRFPYLPQEGRLHVAHRSTTTRFHDPDDARRPLRPRPDVVLHRTDPVRVDASVGTGIAPPLTTLEHAFRNLPPEHALAVLDSALHLRFLRTTDLLALTAVLPSHLHATVKAADGRADSGLETIARHLLRLAGLDVRVHPVLVGIGEVDLLVEGRLILELDGRQFHDDEEAFARDRARDLIATRTRYRTLRLTWRQVLFDWPAAEEAVFAALAG